MRRGRSQALIGTHVALEVGGERIDMGPEVVLVSDGRSLQLYSVTAADVDAGPEVAPGAERVWRLMTRRAADRVLEGRLADGAPARTVGRVTRVWRYGEIGGRLDYWVHAFSPPGPMLERRPDGYRLRRQGAQYRLSGRGIVG